MRQVIVFLAAVCAASGQTRIVSTAPAITETLFALGLGGKVVGVSTFCHFPAEAAARPKIGSYLHPNVETILRLRPDLVIMEKLPDQAMEQLRTAGVPVKQISTGGLAANLQMIVDIAEAANVRPAGEALKAKVLAEIDGVRHQSQQRKRSGVIFIVGRTPGRLEGMIAVGKASYLNELIAAAGGDNVLAGSVASYPKISLEGIVRLKPAVIIDMGDMADTVGVTEQHKRSVEALWRAQPDVRSRVHAVASDVFVVPGPRMGEAAREFHRLIHGAGGGQGR